MCYRAVCIGSSSGVESKDHEIVKGYDRANNTLSSRLEDCDL
jgi:hypothetical protein